MADIFNIKFIDIDARETEAKQSLLFEIANLRARWQKNHELSEADLVEFRRLKAVRNAIRAAGGKYYDPLFVATRSALELRHQRAAPGPGRARRRRARLPQRGR